MPSSPPGCPKRVLSGSPNGEQLVLKRQSKSDDSIVWDGFSCNEWETKQSIYQPADQSEICNLVVRLAINADGVALASLLSFWYKKWKLQEVRWRSSGDDSPSFLLYHGGIVQNRNRIRSRRKAIRILGICCLKLNKRFSKQILETIINWPRLIGKSISSMQRKDLGWANIKSWQLKLALVQGDLFSNNVTTCEGLPGTGPYPSHPA